jgi:hypothetical protein
MAETEFRERGNTSAQHNGQLGKRACLSTTVCEWGKGREGERIGGHVTEGITKNLTRKI